MCIFFRMKNHIFPSTLSETKYSIWRWSQSVLSNRGNTHHKNLVGHWDLPICHSHLAVPIFHNSSHFLFSASLGSIVFRRNQESLCVTYVPLIPPPRFSLMEWIWKYWGPNTIIFLKDYFPKKSDVLEHCAVHSKITFFNVVSPKPTRYTSSYTLELEIFPMPTYKQFKTF